MDTEVIEDMLFGAPDSQASFDDLWSEDSDDELLDAADMDYESDDDLFEDPVEVTTDSWQLPSSPFLKATQDTEGSHNNMAMADRSISREKDKFALVDASKNLPRDRYWVTVCVEAMLERIVDGLLEGSEKLTFTLKSRAGIPRKQQESGWSLNKIPVPREREISFPGNTAQEAWNFTVLLRIIELIHGGLINNTIMTKRDIYYRHPDLFVKQSVVDRYVDDLACTIGVSRSQLNVTAAAKGLVAGSFTISREDGTQVDGSSDGEGMLVPKIGEDDQVNLTRARWILVIEKEATFRSLLSTSQWNDLGLHGVVLTAKGYPDVASRRFLRQLTEHAPHIPMYALVDLDPDGIAILSTYKYGSYRLAHEDVASNNTSALSLPDIRWLGVKRHHISRTPVNRNNTDTIMMPALQGLARLTARDRTKAVRMLEWDLCAEAGPEPVWRRELQIMLMLNVKAEMQVLDELPGGVVSFLSNELDGTGEAEVEVVVDMACSDDGLLF